MAYLLDIPTCDSIESPSLVDWTISDDELFITAEGYIPGGWFDSDVKVTAHRSIDLACLQTVPTTDAEVEAMISRDDLWHIDPVEVETRGDYED